MYKFIKFFVYSLFISALSQAAIDQKKVNLVNYCAQKNVQILQSKNNLVSNLAKLGNISVSEVEKTLTLQASYQFLVETIGINALNCDNSAAKFKELSENIPNYIFVTLKKQSNSMQLDYVRSLINNIGQDVNLYNYQTQLDTIFIGFIFSRQSQFTSKNHI